MGIGDEAGIMKRPPWHGACVVKRSCRGKGGVIGDRDERKAKGRGNRGRVKEDEREEL